jgi:hypothetical protein
MCGSAEEKEERPQAPKKKCHNPNFQLTRVALRNQGKCRLIFLRGLGPGAKGNVLVSSQFERPFFFTVGADKETGNVTALYLD